MVHAPTEAARQLRAQHGLTPDRIARIRVTLDEACARICNIPAPQTGLEAQFSLRLATAMGRAGGDTGRLSTSSAAPAADSGLVAVRDQVELDFRSGLPATFAAIELTLRDGSTLTAQHDAGIPAVDTVEQGRRRAEQFVSLVEPVLGGDTACTLSAAIGPLEALRDVRGLLAHGAR